MHITCLCITVKPKGDGKAKEGKAKPAKEAAAPTRPAEEEPLNPNALDIRVGLITKVRKE